MQEVQGERRPLELSPKVQVGGSNSSGAPVGTPAHSSSKETDAVMDSADVDIPLADRTHATAIESSSSSKSVKGTKRTRDIDEECEDRVAAKIPATTFVGLKEDAVAAAPSQVAAVWVRKKIRRLTERATRSCTCTFQL